VLLRLARGSGARSLAAMRPRQDPWRRPFLSLPRADVRAVAAELLAPLGRTAWTDPHNADAAFARVRVRGVLDDLGSALGPGVVLGLSRSADLLRDDADALDELAKQAFDRLVSAEASGVGADCTGLAALPRALRTRVIRLMGVAAGCPADRLGHDLVAAVETLVVDWHGQGGLRLPGRVEAVRTCGRLSLHRA
jgi:tRNA(Ile)-lysidine synthase